jgi:hypothetical protein
MQVNKELLKSSLILTLVFVIVSLDKVYSLTHSILGGSSDQNSYGPGASLTSMGLWIHSLVFFIIVYFLAVYMAKHKAV